MKKKENNVSTQTSSKVKTDPTPSSQKKSQSEDKVFTYCYILSTAKQREALDLTKGFHTKLEKTIKEFFTTRLHSIEIYKDRYILKLYETYSIGDKRRVGRLISEYCDLKAYVHKISYNNAQDSSGQLFRICNEKEKLKYLPERAKGA